MFVLLFRHSKGMYCFYQAPNLATIVSGPILIAIALRGSFVIEKQVIKVKQQIPVIMTLFIFYCLGCLLFVLTVKNKGWLKV